MEAASKWALLCLQPHSWLPPPGEEVVTAPHPLPPFTEGSIPPQSPIPLYPTPQGSHLSSLPPHHRAAIFPPCPHITGQPSSLPAPTPWAAIFPPYPHVTGQPSSLRAITSQGSHLPSLPPGHRAACRVHKNCAPSRPML